MEPYVNYVKDMQARGMAPEQIRALLSERGIDQQTIERLVPASGFSTTQTASAASSTPSAVDSSSSSQPQAPSIEAYIDYVKALLARGMTPQAIDKELETHGLDSQTRTALFQALAKSTPPASYPSQITTQTNRPMGQAPGTAEALVDEAIISSPPHAVFGWLITAISCLIPSIFIILDAPNRFLNGTHTLLTLGDIFAVVGLCLYVIDLLLATRMARIEDVFGGLNRVYVAHAIIGGAALTAILVHPVLLAIRYMPLGIHTVATFFIPTTKYIGSAFGIVALAMMLVLLIITFYVSLPYKLWLVTHKYLGAAYLLICVHVLFTPNVITNNIFVRWYLIVLVIVGLAAFVYRTLLPNIFVRRYVYLVQAAVEKTKGVVEVTLVPVNKAIQFQAGQFIFLSFKADGLSPEWHPFTVVSPPGTPSLSIDVKSLGGYTETITHILPDMVGKSALIEGAYGRFSFRNFRNLNQVWIAGGIGITPFLSMAQKLGAGPYNIDLYYSVRSEAELIDLDKLINEQQNQPGKVFRVFPFVTEKYKRHLTAELIAATTGDLSKRDFLICGPEPMMDSMRMQLQRLGVKKYKIHSEEFSIT